MFSLVLGLATGIAFLLNGSSVRRGIAKLALTGGDAAAAAARGARRVSARVIEDFEDAFAEVKHERALGEAQQQSASELLAEVQQLRADLHSLEPKTGRTVQ